MTQTDWKGTGDFFGDADEAIKVHLQSTALTGLKATAVNAIHTALVAAATISDEPDIDADKLSYRRFPHVFIWSGGTGVRTQSFESNSYDALEVSTRFLLYDYHHDDRVSAKQVIQLAQWILASMRLTTETSGSDWTDFYSNWQVPELTMGPVGQFAADDQILARSEIVMRWWHNER